VLQHGVQDAMFKAQGARDEGARRMAQGARYEGTRLKVQGAGGCLGL
jgi:hypothetical protein